MSNKITNYVLDDVRWLMKFELGLDLGEAERVENDKLFLRWRSV